MMLGVTTAEVRRDVKRLERRQRQHVRPVTRRLSEVAIGEGVWQNIPDVNLPYVCTCEGFQSGNCEHVQKRMERDVAEGERRQTAEARKAIRLDKMRQYLDEMLVEDEREEIAREGTFEVGDFDPADFGRFEAVPLDLEFELAEFTRAFLWGKSVAELKKLLTQRRIAGEWTQRAHKETIVRALMEGLKWK